jgi:hypothetical protein
MQPEPQQQPLYPRQASRQLEHFPAQPPPPPPLQVTNMLSTVQRHVVEVTPSGTHDRTRVVPPQE